MTQQGLNGLIYCGQVLIPSLFPFMVLAEFLSEYGVLDRLAFIFSPLCRKILKLPAAAGGAVILSMTGGFPVGGACVRTLYEKGKITAEQAQRMLRFAVGAGPAFVIFAVGQNMLSSVKSGVVLYAAQVLSQLTIAVVGGIASKDVIPKENRRQKQNQNFSDCLISSCFKSSDSTIKLCAMVVMFSALMGVLSDIGFIDFFEWILSKAFVPRHISHSLIYALTEVTSGCREAVLSGSSLEFIAFVIGFGGISVHFQIFALLGDLEFSKLDFFIHRILCGFICSVYTYIISFFMPETAEVISIVRADSSVLSSSTLIGSMALLLCCVIFVCSLKNGGKSILRKNAYNIKRVKTK